MNDLPETPDGEEPRTEPSGDPSGRPPNEASTAGSSTSSEDPAAEPRTSATDQHKSASAGDSRKLMLAVGILVLIALVAVGVGIARNASKNSSDSSASSTTTTKAGSTSASGCPPGTWPSLYQGKPQNLDAAKDTGYYVWNDAKGWHVRALDTKSSTTFRVKITASTKLDQKLFVAVPANAFDVTVSGNSATFDMPGGPTPNGVDFSLPCATTQLSFDLGTDALPWPVHGIWVGKENTAVTNPVIAQKA